MTRKPTTGYSAPTRHTFMGSETGLENAMTRQQAFNGYHRPNGSVGIRNDVLVLSVTGLTTAPARQIGAAVQGCHVITMPYSTGLVGRDREVHYRALVGLACNPNVGAVLLISDHKPKAETLAHAINARGQSVQILTLNEVEQDTVDLVAKGTRIAAQLARHLSKQRTAPAPVSSLRVGLKCGRSDPSSGLIANPSTGMYIDQLIAQGGTAIFGEVVEWIGAEHLLAQRAASAEIAERLTALPAGREAAALETGLDLMGSNPSPTNIAAGLSSIEEKSLGGISKTGSSPILGVLDYAEAPQEAGLFAMDTPNYAPEHLTALAAAGCQIALFTTGAGNSFVSGLMPTIKICGNQVSCQLLVTQFDVRLDDLVETADPLPIGSARIAETTLDVANGQLTWGEVLKQGDDVISRFGAAL